MTDAYEEIDNYSFSSNELLNDIYSSDIVSNYYKLKRRRCFQENDEIISKSVNIKVYSSGDTGSFIVNAETGYTSRCRVGSADERLFFSVAICTGEGRNRQPISLYYDSPEQYETHYITTVNPEVKAKWKRRQKEYLRKLSS